MSLAQTRSILETKLAVAGTSTAARFGLGIVFYILAMIKYSRSGSGTDPETENPYNFVRLDFLKCVRSDLHFLQKRESAQKRCLDFLVINANMGSDEEI